MNQMVVSVGRGTNELIQLQLKNRLLATLGVLNDEEHDEGDRICHGCEHHLPFPGESIDRRYTDKDEHNDRRADGRTGSRSEFAKPVQYATEALRNRRALHEISN